MTSFLGQLGSRLADRWAASLIAPGLLLVAAAVAAAWAGQSHAVDFTWLARQITARAAAPAAHSPGVLILGTAGVLAAGTATGLAAGAVGWTLERAWMTQGESLLGRVLVSRRRRRWKAANARLQKAMEESDAVRSRLAKGFASQVAAGQQTPAQSPGTARRRRDAIALMPPARPTWIADRVLAVEERVRTAYGLEMEITWPRLWPVISETLRADLAAAQDAYSAAARLTGWGLLYAILTVWWWPAGLIATVTILTARVRTRAAIAVLADLIEAAVDLHGRDLAAQLGITCDGHLTHDVGTSIAELLAKDHMTGTADRRSAPAARDHG